MKVRSVLVPLCFTFATASAAAQGIPVIDAANLIQAIQQVVNDITKINNQVQQIVQLRSQLESINGYRYLGTVFDSPLLHNYVPAQAYRAIDSVRAGGYDALGGTARVLREQGMVYNCEELAAGPRANCQAALAQPYQYKGLLQDAMRTASGRLSQIGALMRQINATADQKAVQEIQARVGVENALLAHELSQVQMLQAMGDSDDRIARSKDRERQYEMLGRTRRVAEYLR
jgi:type IV secretion system protein VirB5